MDNRVYYGEYSLKHWIDLILKKNLILPKYQRYFVWNEKKVETLIATFEKKQFVPPVTIGAFKDGNTNQNLILDGQQRLTSILLAYLGLFPDKTFKKEIEKFVNENDDEEGTEEQFDNVFEWRFELLTQEGKNKQEILSKIVDGKYKKIDFKIDDKFLETKFLGFSYLVPDISNNKTQQEKAQLKYYSSVFRNINIQGEPLLPQESRASLYYLDHDLEPFFEPKFAKGLVVKGISSSSKADFVRYLSLLSQYYKDKNSNQVARGYKPKMEKYYEEYIYAAVADDNSETYGKFSAIFPNRKFDTRFTRLEETISSIGFPKSFPSIIDLDVYLFGSIYKIVFEDKIIDTSKKDELKKELDEQILKYKQDPSHTKAPSNLGHLRKRISTSIEIYGKYAK